MSMKQSIDALPSELRPKYPLRGAIQHLTKRWNASTRFLESGAIPRENNAAERSMKLRVITKKNHVFSASLAGGEAATERWTFFSLAKATDRRSPLSTRSRAEPQDACRSHSGRIH